MDGNKKKGFFVFVSLYKTAIFAVQILDDLLAQLVEHIPFKDGVLGSRPS